MAGAAKKPDTRGGDRHAERTHEGRVHVQATLSGDDAAAWATERAQHGGDGAALRALLAELAALRKASGGG